ncbi:MAG TPA: hypothetical protein VNZ67_11560, partial [bacterium]|nr:hypothetical protein [bacterium]
ALVLAMWFWKREGKAAAWGLVAAVLPSLVFLAVTHSLMPDSARPKSAGLMQAPLALHGLISGRFALDSVSALFLNLRGLSARVGISGDAASGNPPYVHYLPFALAFALAGFAFKRQFLPLLAWGLCTWLMLCWTLPVGWHQHRYLSALAPVMLLGFASLLDSLERAPRLALACAWCLFGCFSVAWFQARQSQSADLYQSNHGAAAAWLRSHAAAGERLAVADAGILAWQSGLPTVDLLGITDHQLALAAPQGERAILRELLARPQPMRPSLAALHWERPDFNPQRWVRCGLLQELDTIDGGAGGHLGIFRFDWSKAQACLQ